MHVEVGYNSRLDELQAAALRVLLPQLEGWTRARREAAQADERAGIGDLVASSGRPRGRVRVPPRRGPARSARARRGTRQAGVETRAYYTTPLNRQPALVDGADVEPLPNSERLAAEGLALPMGQALDAESAVRVVEALRAVT